MASLDLNLDYKKVEDKLAATKSYTQLKGDYDNIVNNVSGSFEQAKQNTTNFIDNVKEQKKRYQRQIKNQFDKLLDINTIALGSGGQTNKFLKRTLLEALKNSIPRILELTIEESIKAVGCDQQQTYNSGPLKIKVSSLDLGGLLKIDPNSEVGKVVYEKKVINVQSFPFSMNRELFNRIKKGTQTFNNEYSNNYVGASGQQLFDISFDSSDQTFVINLQNRIGGVNRVGDFLVDYYKTIEIFSFEEVITQIMEYLSGALSIKLNIGLEQSQNASSFELLIQRVLGLCFDNRSEIDVSGISKIAELDGVDESFFEFTEIDLRNIEQKYDNIKNGVVQYENCDNVKLPVDADNVINGLLNLFSVPDNDLVDTANNITKNLTNNPEWSNLILTGNIEAPVDLNFMKLLAQGLVSAILTPKVLLPIYIMLKSLQQNNIDNIKNFTDFCKTYSKFFISFVSKAGAIFVEELFIILKRNILTLIQQIISDIAKEQKNKKLVTILKLISLLLIVANFIDDWRKCKSVIDEILALLNLYIPKLGLDVPLPLLFATQLLDGYSESRAFLGTIEELQKLGIPTGPMPDGSPNLQVLSIFSQLKASSLEEAENGKVQIAIGPLAITPAGLTIPSSAYGKKL